MSIHSILAEKAAEAEKSSSSKKVTGSRYIVTKNGNHLNLLVHKNVAKGQSPCTYIYTDAQGKYAPHPTFEIQEGKLVNQIDWGFALKWNQPQVQMTEEYEKKVIAAVAERKEFLKLPVAERFKFLPVKA